MVFFHDVLLGKVLLHMYICMKLVMSYFLNRQYISGTKPRTWDGFIVCMYNVNKNIALTIEFGELEIIFCKHVNFRI